MYYSDLSIYEYTQNIQGTIYDKTRVKMVCSVGWLAKKYKYPTGEICDMYLERLWYYCYNFAVNATLGLHLCPFCPAKTYSSLARRGNEECSLGGSEVWVLGHDGIVYAAPNLLYHYMQRHQYRPPTEFLDALMTGPLPGTSAYDAVIKIYISRFTLQKEGWL